jgi:hypothetical protein
VTVGVLNAVAELEDLTGRTFIRDGKLIVPRESDTAGMDLYLSTSSAGGGLQMLVAGVVKAMTAESAERAALGAGAIVIDTLAVDDGRKEYQRVERIRNIRPDMILLSGGTDGGTTQHLLDLSETLRAADPKPRTQGQGNGFPALSFADGFQGPSNAFGASLAQQSHTDGNVVGRNFGMPAHHHDDLGARLLQTGVEALGHNAPGILHYPHTVILRLDLLKNFPRAVGGAPVGDDNFHQLSGIVLSQHRSQALPDVFFFVAYGHDDGDKRQTRCGPLLLRG